ncbi:MAG: ParB/RepB/Spo0J family partition protein [Gammaproteobacteria bacterium]|nr:ParB/RepB/Spo0J family partition protein [Gammaproteobacteria bacterium]
MDRSQCTTDAELNADHPYAAQLAEAGYSLHPLAALFPPMQDDEFLALCESIRLHGQREPVLVWNGRILDGAHRTRACLRLGITPKTEQFKGDADDAQAMVLDLNLHRRHLSTSQRAMIAAGLAARGQGRPSTNGEKPADLPVLTQAEAAALLNVGERTLREAKRLMSEADDDLVEDVRSGASSINAALEEQEKREWMKEWNARQEERERSWAKTAEKREERHRQMEAAREKEEREWAENRPRCPEGWTEQEPRWPGELRWTRQFLIGGESAELLVASAGVGRAHWEITTERYHTMSTPYDRLETVSEALEELQAHLPGL